MIPGTKDFDVLTKFYNFMVKLTDPKKLITSIKEMMVNYRIGTQKECVVYPDDGSFKNSE